MHLPMPEPNVRSIIREGKVTYVLLTCGHTLHFWYITVSPQEHWLHCPICDVVDDYAPSLPIRRQP